MSSPILSGPPRAAIQRDAAGILHVVALSGGKDSTAMALELRERMAETPFIYVCTPTGDELPEMFAHWARLGSLLRSSIWPLSKGQSLRSLIQQWNSLPNFRQRWCTRMLKIVPYGEWLALQVTDGPVRSYVGLRADEPNREGGDYSQIGGVEMIFPMREWGWGLAEVLSSLEQRNVKIPRRTDCARCYHQTLFEWWLLWSEYPEIYEDAVQEEKATGHTFRSPGRDTWPSALDDLRKEFQTGRVPTQRKRVTQCRICMQ